MSKPQMTPEQARATEPDVTAWVGASAGTGKTHVLTARVLRLMLTGTPPENILCLTFTKAGAAEMKTRIFEELGRWARLEDSELVSEITRRTQEIPDDAMIERARQLFAHVLDLNDGLNIQTFHSFCQSLLGRFPLEASLTPGFAGIEESEARALMSEARDKALMHAFGDKEGKDRDALKAVAGLVTETTFDEVISKLGFEANTLRGAYQGFGRNLDQLIEGLYAALGVNSSGYPYDAAQSLSIIGSERRAHLFYVMDALLAGTAAEAKRGDAIRTFLKASDTDRARAYPDFEKVFLTQDFAPKKTVITKKTQEAYDRCDAIIADECDRLIRTRTAAASAALLRLGIRQLNHYDTIKSARGLVDFDDMISKTVGLFERADVAPWILYKLDSAIDHILIDEAQDTNPHQWLVVEAIASEFFAGAGAQEKPRTVFAVGDAKQSIFSFQRADPQEFIDARGRVFARAQAADYQVDNIPLDRSFRSGAAVLNLVDATFAPEADCFKGLISGEAIQHGLVREGHGGLVELWPLFSADPPGAEDESTGWQPPLKQETIRDAEEQCADAVAKRIGDMLSDGEILASKGRPVRPEDILILVRRRRGFVDHLVKALALRGVPVAGRDRMMLVEELPVMDLIALGNFALNPGDDLTLATVLKSPLVGVSEEALFDIAHGRKAGLWQSLLQHSTRDQAFAEAANYLRRVLNLADQLTPFEFYSEVLNMMEGRKAFAARLGDSCHDPIDEFLDMALRFEESQPSSLQAFLRSMEESTDQIKRDMENEGGHVRIMTTHSAKGLQAPIVFLADTVSVPDIAKDGRILPFKRPGNVPDLLVWSGFGKSIPFVAEARETLKNRLIDEYHRLLYVALTRAEDRLYVTGWEGNRKVSDLAWYRQVEAGFGRLNGIQDTEVQDDQTILKFEVPQTLEVDVRAEPSAPQGTDVRTPDWLFQNMPEEQMPPRPLAPSMDDEEIPRAKSPINRGKGIALSRGRIIHTLLEWLPGIGVDARESAAKRYIDKHGSTLSERERLTIWREVEAILSHSDFGVLFGANSKAEVPVAGMVGVRPIAGQVDRLVIEENSVLVIDYKTNRPAPQAIEGVDKSYIRQLALYAAVLETIYPDKEIRTVLLWTDEARLMEVPFDLRRQSIEAFV